MVVGRNDIEDSQEGNQDREDAISSTPLHTPAAQSCRISWSDCGKRPKHNS